MDIYTDYANWKFENYDFIHELITRKSNTITRFTTIIATVDYLYEDYIKRGSLTEDEQVFFSIGFDTIYDNFYTIKTLLDYQFDGDYDQLEKCAKSINLLLYVHEFQSELKNENIDKNELTELDNLEERINTYLDKKENVPDEFFPLLDDIVTPIFDRHEIVYVPVEAIYYEIAVEYGIYKDKETDIYNFVFNEQKIKHQKH